MLRIILLLGGHAYAATTPAVAQAVERAQAGTQKRFNDEHSLMRDCVGELPTPKAAERLAAGAYCALPEAK